MRGGVAFMKTYHRFKFGTIQEWKAEKEKKPCQHDWVVQVHEGGPHYYRCLNCGRERHGGIGG